MTFPPVSTNDNANAGAAFQSAVQASGLNVSRLNATAQLQLAVANLYLAEPATAAIPAEDVLAGIFGANKAGGADTGIYSVPSQFGVGGAGTATIGLRVAGSATAAAAVAHGVSVLTTLVAAANGDTLSAVLATPTFTPGAFTGLIARGFRVSPFSVAAFTSPADPAGVSVGIVTGTGATNAFGVLIAPPTGATNNYLLSHTTPTTFNVTGAGKCTALSYAVNGHNGADGTGTVITAITVEKGLVTAITVS